MKVQITFVDTNAELRWDAKGYRLIFKYADDNNNPKALNECSSRCCNLAAIFCSEFFSMEGLLKDCFTGFTKIQTYKYNSGIYPKPFNGMTGGIFIDDNEHRKDATLSSTCGIMAEAVCEISTICEDSFDKLAEYAEKFKKKFKEKYPNIEIQFVK